MVFQIVCIGTAMADEVVNQPPAANSNDATVGTNSYPVNSKDSKNNSYQKIYSKGSKKGSKFVESIKLESYSANKSSSLTTLFPRYKICNDGNSPIKLANIKVRYYYTINSEASQNFYCDSSSIGSSSVVGRFVKIPAQTDGVDYCLEITFKENSGLLKPGEVVELQCRIEKSDSSEFVQTDDYSYNPTSPSYADFSKVTGYINDKLIYGVEPISAPTNITVSAISKDIILNWDSSTSCTGYDVEVDGVLVKNISSNTYTHSGLIPGTKHEYRVRLRNAIILGPWSDKISYTLPFSDKFNMKQSATEDTISLSWDNLEGAEQYNLEVDGEVIDNGSQTSYQLSGLESGTKHTVKLQAKGDALDSEWSDVVDVWTLPGVPADITTSSSKSAITLNWEKVRGALGYDVEVYGTPEDNSDQTTYTQYDLQPNSQRTYRVRAKNPSGAGQWSEVIAATTLPDSALNMQTIASDTSIKVTWDAQAGATSYDLEIDGTDIIEVTDNTYTHVDLQPNTIHTYKARPKNENGVGEWSELAVGTTLPSTPINFKVVSVSGTSISLSWDGVSGATGYDVEVDGEIFNIGNITEFVHEKLKNNEEHNYRVRARNEKILGAWTTELRVCTLLPAPANLKATLKGEEIIVEWDMVVGADGYGLDIDGTEYRLDSNTEYVHTTTESGIQHTYKIRAYRNGEPSEWSSSVTKTTMLGKPTTLQAITISSVSIDISWDSVNGAQAYDLMVDDTVVENITSTTYSHINLSPNTLHTYMVRAKDNEIVGEWSNKISATTLLAVPAKITASAISSTITLTWDEVDGAESYDVQIDGNVIETVSETSFKNTGLVPNTSHSYKVRATNKSCAGDWSSEIVQSTGPNVPQNFKANATINQIILTWDVTQGAISYDIQEDGETIENTTNSSITITGLEPGSRHEYKIRAKNIENVSSEWSEILEVNTTDVMEFSVEKDAPFNFVIAIPKKADVDGYDVIVTYSSDKAEVVDLYGTTMTSELTPGAIQGTNISVTEFSEGNIVYHVKNTGKPVMLVLKLVSKSNEKIELSYVVE